MNCQKISNQPELALDYVAGSPDAEFEQHLRQCEDCASIVAAQRKVWESLDQLSAPEVQGDFDARLYARIAQEESQPAWRRWLNRVLHPALPMAAWKPAVAMAVVALGLSVYWAQTPAHTGVTVGHQIEPSRVDIEQVANAMDDLDVLMPAKSVM